MFTFERKYKMANIQVGGCLTTLVIRDTNENKSFFT